MKIIRSSFNNLWIYCVKLTLLNLLLSILPIFEPCQLILISFSFLESLQFLLEFILLELYCMIITICIYFIFVTHVLTILNIWTDLLIKTIRNVFLSLFHEFPRYPGVTNFLISRNVSARIHCVLVNIVQRVLIFIESFQFFKIGG